MFVHQHTSCLYLTISTYHTQTWPTYSKRTAVSHRLVKQNGGERKNETRGLALYLRRERNSGYYLPKGTTGTLYQNGGKVVVGCQVVAAVIFMKHESQCKGFTGACQCISIVI